MNNNEVDGKNAMEEGGMDTKEVEVKMEEEVISKQPTIPESSEEKVVFIMVKMRNRVLVC